MARPRRMPNRKRLLIVGGGPGALFTAFLLQKLLTECDVTIIESGPRVGGKVLTGWFETAPVPCETGLAELYYYAHLGPDPLFELVTKTLNLETVPMTGETVILDDRVVPNERAFARIYGQEAGTSLRNFGRQARAAFKPDDFYNGEPLRDPKHKWANLTWRDLLDTISHPAARRYVEKSTHSDVATEAHLTSAAYGVSNYLMQDPNYMKLYGVLGGNQRLIVELQRRIAARVVVNHRVTRVEKVAHQYRITTDGNERQFEADIVVLALPVPALSCIDFAEEGLRRAMLGHVKHFDSPAHYLRVSLLFEKPYWRKVAPGSYFMVDAFGGTCVYDESARLECGNYGVQGWLLAGNAALSMSPLPDSVLIRQVLEAMPSALANGRELLREAKVQRWPGAVNGLPGGRSPRGHHAHVPDPKQNPMLFTVGDYFSDSTLNAVLDSADTVSGLIADLLVGRAASLPAST